MSESNGIMAAYRQF